MRNLVLFTLFFIGYVATANVPIDPANEKEDYQWLIDEVEEIYEEEATLIETKSMVYIYAFDGQEIASFEEGAYEQLSTATKRQISRSELLFETANDKVYMLAR